MQELPSIIDIVQEKRTQINLPVSTFIFDLQRKLQGFCFVTHLKQT